MAEIIKIRRLEGLAPRRKAAGWTQQGFADLLGVPRTNLAAWEALTSCPRAGILPAIAELLLCTVDDLYRAPEEISSGEDLRRAEVVAPYGEIITDREEGMPCRTTAETSTETQGELPV